MMKPNLDRPKSLSLMLRRSVPKLFLILTASVPAIVIPSIVIARSKDTSLKYVEGECVRSKINERTSPSGRYVVGEKGNTRFTHLIGETSPLEPVQHILVNETFTSDNEQPIYAIPPQTGVAIPEIKTYEQVLEEEEQWQKSVPALNKAPDNLKNIPTPPSEIDLNSQRKQPSCFNQGSDQDIAAIDPSATPQQDNQSGQQAPTDTGSPKSILKIFPLRPENYGQTIKQELEKGQVTTPEANSSGTLKQEQSQALQNGEIQNAPQQQQSAEQNRQIEQPALRTVVPEQQVNAPALKEEQTPVQMSAPEQQSNAPARVPQMNAPQQQANAAAEMNSPEQQTSAQMNVPEQQTPAQMNVPMQQTPAQMNATEQQTPAQIDVPVQQATPPAQSRNVPDQRLNPPLVPAADQRLNAPHADQTSQQAPIQSALQPETPTPANAQAQQATIVQNPQNGPVVVPAQPTNNQGYLANYSNLDIKEFIRFISRITNKNFIFNENDLNFTISMISERRSTPEELIATLMQQLRIHGLAVIEEGDSFIIHTNPEVNSPATVLPRSPGELVPNDVQIITQVFRLNVISPSQAVTILKPLLSSQAVIEPLDDAGILTLTDLKVNVEKVKDLLIQLDIPSSGLDVSHFRSEYINAETLAALGQKVLTPIADGKEIRLIPLSDSNLVFIISTPILVRRAVEFFTALDKEIRYNTGNVSGFNGNSLTQGGKSAVEQELEKEQAINNSLKQPLEDLNNTLQNSTSQAAGTVTEFDYYKLEYRKGDQIQQALSQIGDSISKVQGANDTNNDLSNAIGTVQWIEASNTMIFTGTPSANAKIKQLISDLDIPNQQVLIEMLLLDTSIDKSYRFGVDWGTRFGGPNAAGSQAFLSPESPLPVTLDGNLSPEFLNAQQLARTAGFTLGVIGRTISCDGLTFSNLGALITAIHTEDIGKVILNPKIVVEENNTAEIFVGLNIPFKTQSVANDFGTILTNNFEYRDIGARMTVTPIINRNGIITLEIEQELSTLIDSTTSVITSSFFELSSVAAGAGPTTRKSNSKTTVFVPNGHFVIMSGMIQDESERIRTQVPCLGGVPVLGGAFSQKNNTEQNRNLMIFIRPSLINTEDEMTYFTKREQDIYDQKNHAKDLWKYEIEEALDFLNLNPDSCCK